MNKLPRLKTESNANLDDRLREILADSGIAMQYANVPDNMEYTIAQIKAAFKAEGWKPGDVEVVTRWERGKKPHIFMIEGKEVMTGQQWYQKLEEEMKGKTLPYSGDNHDDVATTCLIVMDAAKRASNLEGSN